MLDPKEKAAVFRHAGPVPRTRTGGAPGLDDLAFLDQQRARRWYGRPVRGPRVLLDGDLRATQASAWTADEDGWYVGEKQELSGPWLHGSSGACISLGAGHNASTARKITEASTSRSTMPDCRPRGPVRSDHCLRPRGPLLLAVDPRQLDRRLRRRGQRPKRCGGSSPTGRCCSPRRARAPRASSGSARST